MKGLFFEENNKCKLFGFLGVRYGVVMVDDEEVGRVWTRADLNTAVGLAVVNHGIDIVEIGAGFIRLVGERLAPNMGKIAEIIRSKKLSADETHGYRYESGYFHSPFCAQSLRIACLADAISMMSSSVGQGLPVEAATKLLQDAINADIPIERPATTTEDSEIRIIVFGVQHIE